MGREPLLVSPNSDTHVYRREWLAQIERKKQRQCQQSGPRRTLVSARIDMKIPDLGKVIRNLSRNTNCKSSMISGRCNTPSNHNTNMNQWSSHYKGSLSNNALLPLSGPAPLWRLPVARIAFAPSLRNQSQFPDSKRLTQLTGRYCSLLSIKYRCNRPQWKLWWSLIEDSVKDVF